MCVSIVESRSMVQIRLDQSSGHDGRMEENLSHSLLGSMAADEGWREASGMAVFDMAAALIFFFLFLHLLLNFNICINQSIKK